MNHNLILSAKTYVSCYFKKGGVRGTHHREGGDAGRESKHILFFFFIFVCLFVSILVCRKHISSNFKGDHLCQMLKSRPICFSSMTEKSSKVSKRGKHPLC